VGIENQPNIPDYANMQSTNRLSSNGTWINDQGDGFVFISVRLGIHGGNDYAKINDTIVISGGIGNASGSASGRITMVFSVRNGDKIELINSSTEGNIGVWFIPPLHTGRQNSVLPMQCWRRVS